MARKLTDQEIRHRLRGHYQGVYEYTIQDFGQVNSRTKIDIYCTTHKVWFKFLLGPHMRGQAGCTRCGYEQVGQSLRRSHEDFLNLVYDRHSDDITILSEYLGATHQIQGFCEIHEYEFQTLARSFYENDYPCPLCATESRQLNHTPYKTEKSIGPILDNLGYEWKTQVAFKGCIYKNHLLFDYYIPSLNTVIEYQGEQHYKPVKIMGGQEAFELRQLKDNIKREFCEEQGIRLIEIPHTVDDIEKFLRAKLY